MLTHVIRILTDSPIFLHALRDPSPSTGEGQDRGVSERLARALDTARDTVLCVLRAYHEAVQETLNNRDAALKVLAKYVRLDDPENLAEVYKSYGQKHLQKTINADLEGVNGMLKGLGSEATGANAANFVDASLMQELEREGFFQKRSR